jgi:ATP-dependent DNA ligase
MGVLRRDLTARPLRDRRAWLEDVVARSDLVFPARRLAPDGQEGMPAGTGTGLRGLVTKEEIRQYMSGPTKAWLDGKVPGWTDREDR